MRMGPTLYCTSPWATFELNDLEMHYLQWSRHTVVAAHFPSNDFLLQDDNAPVHRARSVKEFMEQENIPTME